MQITFTIPDEKVQRVVNAIAGLFPIPRDENGNLLFTKSQWAKEKIRRTIINLVYRYERKKASELIEKDDTLIS